MQSHYSPGQDLRVPEGLGSQISKQLAHEGGTVVRPMHWLTLPPRKYSWYYFCQRLSRPQGHSAARRIMSIKNSTDSIGNRTCDLLAGSAVPQPNVPPCAHRWQVAVHKYLPDQRTYSTYNNASSYSGWLWVHRQPKLGNIIKSHCKEGFLDFSKLVHLPIWMSKNLWNYIQ